MKRISWIFMMVALTADIFYLEQSKSEPVGECEPDEYYSDVTKKCERATIQIGLGEEIESLSISDLRARYQGQVSEMIVTENPAYVKNGTNKRVRKYRGVYLTDIVNSLLPAGESLADYVIAFAAIDGFDSTLDGLNTSNLLSQRNALLAFEQIEIKDAVPGVTKDGRWELVELPGATISPGPFYLVWNKPAGTTPLDWPFQVKSLWLMKASVYKKLLAKVEPSKDFMGLKPKSPIEKGFKKFQGICMTCHQINGLGGKKSQVDLPTLVGAFDSPDESLNHLKYVVENPPDGMIDVKSFKLSEDDLSHINAYLRHMASRRQ